MSLTWESGAVFGAPGGRHRALGYAVVAAVVTLLLWGQPWAAWLLYPLRILVTLVHEGGHALATLLTGGSVERILVQPDASGVTFSRGGWALAIAPAGYMGAAAYGAVMLSLMRGSVAGRRALYVSAALLGLLTLLFVRNLFGFAAGVVLTVGLAAGGRYLPPPGALFLSSFLAVQCCLNALLDLLGLVFSTGLLPTGHNDAVLMARLIPLPPIVWALLWSIASALLVWGAVRSLWNRTP